MSEIKMAHEIKNNVSVNKQQYIPAAFCCLGNQTYLLQSLR